MNTKVDFFFNKASKWQDEYKKLRSIVLECGLQEELKWGFPCYNYQNGNVVLIHGFKDYCALLFHKGALMKDANRVLIQQTENVQAARQIRFANIREIIEMGTLLRDYINEAIELERAGLKVTFKKSTEFKIATEFQNKMDEFPGLKVAFDALTPGRQRAYLLHFSAPKQSKTRVSRVEKCMHKIIVGKGLDDK